MSRIDFALLAPFLKKAANNPAYPAVQEHAVRLSSNLDIEDAQQDDEIADPHLQKKEHDGQLGNPDAPDAGDVQLESKLLQASMPELSLPEPNDTSTFGKLANMLKRGSAYVRDVRIGDLPVGTKDDVVRFAGEGQKREVIEYGMVVRELISKVDPHNFKQAEAHIADEMNKKSRKQMLEDFFKKHKEKYILILNDRIIDGHHFLAKAKALNITCSLKVLDLTPTRFQKAANTSILARLRAAKKKSDSKDFAGKSRIMAALLREHRSEFRVDQPKPDYPGITHMPTGFKLHVPKGLTHNLLAMEKKVVHGSTNKSAVK